MVRAEYNQFDASLRKFAATLRKRRHHERRRRRKQDGYSAPFAERTWHRVVLSEQLRRLVKEHAVSDAPIGTTPTSTFAATYNQNLAPTETPLAEKLLDDIRLDGKQRALILRFGGAMMGDLQKQQEEPPTPTTSKAEQPDDDGGNAEWQHRLARPTRRQRRQRHRRVEKELLERVPASLHGKNSAVVERHWQLQGLECVLHAPQE